MIVVEGKEVFTELHELVDPEHTALLLIDMQRDFVEADGLFGRLGIDRLVYDASPARLAALLAAGRRSTASSSSTSRTPRSRTGGATPRRRSASTCACTRRRRR